MAKNLSSKYKKKSAFADVWKRLKRNKSAMIGLFIITLIIAAALTAPLFLSFDEHIAKQNIKNRLQWPNAQDIFGTDHVGRSVFYRIIWGSRISVFVGIACIAVSLLVGGILGAVAGFYGKHVDNIIMRIMDIFLAIPGQLLAITIVAALGPGLQNLILALAISNVPTFARIVRSSVLTVRDTEYIEAARAIGATNSRIIFKHIIPNSLAPVIVQTTLSVANIILTIAGLSYIGLGVQAPTPEWGQMLSESQNFMMKSSYLTMFPGLAIVITILALNLLGDGLRDAMDPRLK